MKIKCKRLVYWTDEQQKPDKVDFVLHAEAIIDYTKFDERTTMVSTIEGQSMKLVLPFSYVDFIVNFRDQQITPEGIEKLMLLFT